MRNILEWRRVWAVAVLAVLVIAPLGALTVGAANGGGPWQGGYFTYSGGSDTHPTLFITPDAVPVATWEDGQDRLRLSELSLTEPPKVGLVLSNLPWVPSAPIAGDVDQVAMDANGVLHVVWADGDGGVWHKGFDAKGNVLTDSHRYSTIGVMASNPAIAATDPTSGLAAWVVWVEEHPTLGTHVRLVSIDASGMVIDSHRVDGLLDDLSPTACDVSVDMDLRPHVTFLAEDGAYWAVPDEDLDLSFELHNVHGPDEGSLPVILHLVDGPSWAVWKPWGPYLSRSLSKDGLGPSQTVKSQSGHDSHGGHPRASDIATVRAGGPMAIAPDDPGEILFFDDGSGGLISDDADVRLHVVTGLESPSVATDARGQTYKAASNGRSVYGGLDCYYIILARRADCDISSPTASAPETPVLMRSGTSLEIPIVLTSRVGYDTDYQIELGARANDPPLIATLTGDDHFSVASGEAYRTTVDVTVSMTASAGDADIIQVLAYPQGWPDAAISLDIHVAVPQYHPFIVRAPEGPVTALPGQTVPVTFTIISWSDSDEIITLEPSAPKGWTAETTETRSLPAGGTIEVEVEVTAPEGAPQGTVGDVRLGGITEGGETGADALVPAVVAAHTGVAMDLGDGPLVVAPGSAVDTNMAAGREVRVRNTGNLPVDVSFHAQPNRDGWVAWTTPETMELTPGSEATLGVFVGAPKGALWGTQAQVLVVAAHEDGPSLDVAYLPCSVEHDTDYYPAFLPGSTPLMNGHARVDLLLVNSGNGFQDVTLELVGVPVGWTAEIEGYGTYVRIAPAGTRTFQVTVTAPVGTPPGEVGIVARMWGSDGLKTSLLRVNVLKVFTARMEMDAQTRTLTPPGTVVFPFKMVSTGNADGEAHLSLEGLPYGWDYAFSTPEGVPVVSHPMEVGQTVSAQLSLRIPGDAEGDTHVIDLVVRDRYGELLVRMPVYVRLRLPDLAVVNMIVLPTEPREGTPITIRATVLNLGMADAEDVSVVLKEGNTVIDRDTLSIVPRMGELEVVLYMVPTQGRRTLVLVVDPANIIRERSEANNIIKRHVDVAAPPERPLMTPAVAQASVAIVLTISILGLLGGTETGKYAFLTLVFIPLYTKIKKDRVLDHYLRGKIHGYIIANPGEHYNAIKEQLNVTNGALSYHLRVLDREGYIRSRMDGIFKRFYPADMKLPTTQRNISSFQEVILTIVKNNQGLSQKDIAKRIGASSQVINYHIKILETSQLIRVDRSRRKSKVYAIDMPTAVAVVD